MANNRSVPEVVDVGGLQAALLAYESLVFAQVQTGLMEGKSAPKEKESVKMDYFNALWERLNLDDDKMSAMTDDQSVINHFIGIKNTLASTLPAGKAKFFSPQKMELFKQVILLRQAIALQRYQLNQFLAAETPERLANALSEQGKRSALATSRMDDLKTKFPVLVENTEAVVDCIRVLIQDTTQQGFVFLDDEEPPFEKRYEGDMLSLSTVLHGLPHKTSLDRAIKYVTGKISADKPEIDEARKTIANGEEKLQEIIDFFEGGWILERIKKHDSALSDWLRRQEELTQLMQGLHLNVGRDVFLKIEKFKVHSVETALNAMMGACKAMPNRLCWSKVSEAIQASGQALIATMNAFCDAYMVHEVSFRELNERVNHFIAWREDVLSPQVTLYQSHLNRLHEAVAGFLQALHHSHGVMKKYDRNKCQRLGFFFKHHCIKVAVGGVFGGGIAFSLCFSLFKLELPYALAYTAASLLLGAGGGGAVGGIKERCCPTSEEAKPLLIPAPPVAPEADMKPSYAIASYFWGVYPGLSYSKRERGGDVEEGSVKMERSVYGMMGGSQEG